MTGAIIQFVLSAVVIVVAGIFLTKSADKIAETTKLGRVVVGMVFLATATSLPELSVDISAVRNKMTDLAVGDLMGSSLLNLFILAVADLLHRGKPGLFSRASAIHSLSASMSITVTAMAGVNIFMGARLAPYAIGKIGLGSLSIVIAYILGLRMLYYDQMEYGKENKSEDQQIADHQSDLRKSVKSARRRAILIYIINALVILFAGPYLSESAGTISERTGLGDSFVGTTLVALCTSLPELVTTLSAIRMGSFDLVLGNIFGSNTFNMILLAPLDFVNKGSILAVVSKTHILSSLFIILVTSIAMMGQLYHVERKKRIVEPDAILIILLVIGCLFFVYLFR